MAEQPPRFAVEFGKDGLPPVLADGRLDAPAFHRNYEAIGAVLKRFLNEHSGDVIEIGSGTGQHAAAFASLLPSVTWWPTDFSEAHLKSIVAWREHLGLANVKAPIRLDASAANWALAERGLPEQYTAMFCANVIHISPWPVAEGLFAAAGRHLLPKGRLFLYGPFKRDGQHTAPSNAAFDETLRARDPSWGVRDTADLKKLAAANGLRLVELIEMPANNAIMLFERTT
jgi:SAM-dependent methyltransferase